MGEIKEAFEAAARALCRLAGNPENTMFEGKPMWESYLPEATAAIGAAFPHLIEKARKEVKRDEPSGDDTR